MVEPNARGIGVVRWPRTVPKDTDCAASLGTRTLTNLYNQRPAWLDLAHRKLDEAVLAAYGWEKGILDDDLLAKLLALKPGERGSGDLKQIVACRVWVEVPGRASEIRQFSRIVTK